MTQNLSQSALDYIRIEQAIRFIEENFHGQPTLQEIASNVHLSEYHFQRLFSRWVGISPKRFLQYLTKEYAKQLLDQSRNLLDVTYESGLSSPGRLHDLFVHFEAVTPGEFKRQGEDVLIEFGFHPTPFGECLLATTPRGICAISFLKQSGREDELSDLKRLWKKAAFQENSKKSGQVVRQLFGALNGEVRQPFHLFLKGTNFQIKVWEALLRIPSGSVVSYHDIATYIGKPKAVRAVANAIGQNPVPFLIPCHRVIRKLGEFGGYGGGTARKKAILGWEAAKYDAVSA